MDGDERDYFEARLSHLKELRAADIAFAGERDRRYAEVKIEQEKAIKIKETADLAALGLAREIQTYKDEKANELREQIGSERNLYATKEDLANAVEKVEATIKPLVSQSATFHGRSTGLNAAWGYLVGAVGVLAAVAAILTST